LILGVKTVPAVKTMFSIIFVKLNFTVVFTRSCELLYCQTM